MYDTREELLAKIRLGEDTTFEMKAVVFAGNQVRGPGRDELADELAAIANTSEGVCLLGIDDKSREVTGIPVNRLDAVEALVREVLNDSIVPPLTARVLRMELPDSLGELKPIVRIDVPRSLFVHRSPHGYFHRVGSSKRELSPEILARLFQQRSQSRIIRFDEQAVPETSIADLDTALWSRFVRDASGNAEEILRKLRIVTNDDTGAERLSVGGVLMCTRNPERWLSGAQIEAVCYRGLTRDANYQLDARTITGPLDRQVFDTLSFVAKNMRRPAVKDPARNEVPEYSERALFEAIVNAVAHRDYSIHASRIRCFMFEDRVEIYSPGPPPNSVTVESMPLRQATRNEMVASLLSNCRAAGVAGGLGRTFLMEKRGEGVPIIMNESLRLSNRKPEYQLIDNTEIMLSIWAGKSAVA